MIGRLTLIQNVGQQSVAHFNMCINCFVPIELYFYFLAWLTSENILKGTKIHALLMSSLSVRRLQNLVLQGLNLI